VKANMPHDYGLFFTEVYVIYMEVGSNPVFRGSATIKLIFIIYFFHLPL